ncbi:chaperone modulator CbpM [Massilia oculi]|jgi:chaperone modulatory protein CbpM|uniref:MerR family transcriptional regulator n=1 Tax=Massilia oculi TaxID=945844 RepID=A0A2S2DFF7_9BURK|nr:chaperone modulator CbpM [Massilia oculi]AWL04067.1 MerR family transcriptional regulator [Massilia oculi]
MQQPQTLTGVLLEEMALSLDELARAANVEPEWVVRHVQAGVLGCDPVVQATSLRFGSSDLARVRRLLSIERDFDANEHIAALVIDLSDEVRRLRTRMRVLGLE